MKTISHETTPEILTKHYIPKKTQTSKDRIKREQTARKRSLYTPSARKRERGGKGLLVLEVNGEGQVAD